MGTSTFIDLPRLLPNSLHPENSKNKSNRTQTNLKGGGQKYRILQDEVLNAQPHKRDKQVDIQT